MLQRHSTVKLASGSPFQAEGAGNSRPISLPSKAGRAKRTAEGFARLNGTISRGQYFDLRYQAFSRCVDGCGIGLGR